MPLVVDHEQVRRKIIEAFQECIQERPLAGISMRDVAKKAQMSHQNVLYYFRDKSELILSYVRYAKDFLADKCEAWFSDHEKNQGETNQAYLNRFLEYVAVDRRDTHLLNAAIQVHSLARYDSQIEKIVQGMFVDWKETMKACLCRSYGETMGDDEAEAMMILITGTLYCQSNKVLSGAINAGILDAIASLNR
jgi:Transcriptional regulator